MGVPASDQALVSQVSEGSPAHTVGFEVGDIVTFVNDIRIESIDQLIEVVNANVGQEITVVVDREGKTVTMNLIPRTDPPAGEGAMGIGLTNPLKPMPFFQSIGFAFESTGLIIKETILLPGRLISGAVDPALARPIGYKGIYDVYTWAVEQDTESSLTDGGTPADQHTLHHCQHLHFTGDRQPAAHSCSGWRPDTLYPS